MQSRSEEFRSLLSSRGATDLLDFRDAFEAAMFLRSMLGDPFNVHLLRDALRDVRSGLDVSGLTDHEVVEQLAPAFASGELRLGRVDLGIAGISGTVAPAETEEEEEDEPPAEVVPVGEETHWVEIELVNAGGDPVKDLEYKVVLPDGSEKTGNLDAEGKAMIRDIAESGDCEVSFPGLDAQASLP